jgi:tRNA (guanine37-N1)-methyltransferase
MYIAILTIFPELFGTFLTTSLVGRAVAAGAMQVDVHDLREFASDRHRTVDDEPYGGGAGMVMAAPPWIEGVRVIAGEEESWRVLLSPQGKRLDESTIRELALKPRILLLCGRYEGIDERVRMSVVDEEISIGDFVLSGGEVPAMVLIEALSRQIPGVVGRQESVERDSFRSGLLDYPHYTRPRIVDDMEVPAVLVSGDHREIELWRQRQALLATWNKRRDLIERADLTEEQTSLLAELEKESG